ncbi:hypothetical protein FH608_015475 [Nonomuraea phyllanthi]|uniref:Acyl-CoA thioesterase-like N-terminal HotDog domain-containing protein n=1 Tax=Nonomuraea phyllanthi TaxID=2219224 RepID=A0A5C4WJH5_9ACTN|nr:acyl-CoA thioesterase domain-containing protein [Nonomuraea phyllanthi]KAB8194593.1 hypothetical protein FH608_015475 [Nonomuraea phyllanthi]QFY09017.1 hypothetical protein GBF35_22210 [Nonomuraea phyllanthi]
MRALSGSTRIRAAVRGPFVSAAGPRPAEIHVEPLRAGRNATQVRVRLSQGGAVRIEALITLERL